MPNADTGIILRKRRWWLRSIGIKPLASAISQPR
jgi:hypothetical protein